MVLEQNTDPQCADIFHLSKDFDKSTLTCLNVEQVSSETLAGRLPFHAN